MNPPRISMHTHPGPRRILVVRLAWRHAGAPLNLDRAYGERAVEELVRLGAFRSQVQRDVEFALREGSRTYAHLAPTVARADWSPVIEFERYVRQALESPSEQAARVLGAALAEVERRDRDRLRRRDPGA